jgi:hypothetical protein
MFPFFVPERSSGFTCYFGQISPFIGLESATVALSLASFGQIILSSMHQAITHIKFSKAQLV